MPPPTPHPPPKKSTCRSVAASFDAASRKKQSIFGVGGLVPCGSIDAASHQKKTINLWRCWPPTMPQTNKKNPPAALVVWLALPVALATLPPQCHFLPKNNQPAVFLASFDATSRINNQPAGLVVWFHVCSSIGDVSCFDAVSLQKTSNLRHCFAPMMPCQKNTQLAALVVWQSHGRRHWRRSFDATSPQKINQPAALHTR